MIMPAEESFEKMYPEVLNVTFEGHHFDLEESPSYKGMHTMYHLYTLEVLVDGLPLVPFTTINLRKQGGPFLDGWRWLTWEETLDIIHGECSALDRQDQNRMKGIEAVKNGTVDELLDQVRSMMERRIAEKEEGANPGSSEKRTRIQSASSCLGDTTRDGSEEDAWKRLTELAQTLKDELSAVAENTNQDASNLATMLPPSMVSKMAENTIATQDTADFMPGKGGASSCEQFQAAQSISSRRQSRSTPTTSIPVGHGRRMFTVSRQQSESCNENGPKPPSEPKPPSREGEISGDMLKKAAMSAKLQRSQEALQALRPEASIEELEEPSSEKAAGTSADTFPQSTLPSTKPDRKIASDQGSAGPIATMREAAKAEFQRHGADPKGLIDRGALLKVIDSLCPAQSSQAQRLLDMVGPADSPLVPCSAFLDYVFAD
jgi:hypothetical protein